MTTFLLTSLTLIAFAANSLFCRMALGKNLIDPVSFTSIRLTSGALALILIARFINNGSVKQTSKGSWYSSIALFCYAMAFSLAYQILTTGMGALILFGAVQVTMIAAALKSGERFSFLKWLGLILALVGFIYLVLPGLSAPDPFGAALMCLSGVAWGVYSILGKNAKQPIKLTRDNFTRTIPMTIIVSLIAYSSINLKPSGIILAVISGTLTSGLGYVIWYKTLPKITRSQAAIVQLLVPVLAAFGGIFFLSESLSLRLFVASLMILGGVSIAVKK